MTTFEIKLFGAIEITRDGEPLTDFRSQKALALLAYLICEGRPVTRDYLAGLVWPGLPQQQALGLLRRTLHDLTSKLPGCLDVNRRTVHFPAETMGGTVDTNLFTALAARDDPVAWAKAVDLYRAPFLEGVYLDDAAGLESWVAREQEHWQAQTLHLLTRLVDHHQTKGEYDRALAYVQRLVALAPWQEQAHVKLMLLLAHTGQVHRALAQYHTCRQLLWTELAVEPAPSTQQLYSRLKSVAQQNLPKLPHATTPFVGREAEMAQLTGWLVDAHCRLITLVGVGGMGKSRLALRLAQTVVSDTMRLFLHGVRFAPLAGLDDAAQLVTTVAQALGIAISGRDAVDAQIFHYLRDKELLLVLDNFEQLLNEESLTFLARLLEAAPEVKLIVTSRSRLGLHSEHIYWLQGLQTPPTEKGALDSDGVNNCSAIQLWLETARRHQPDYAITAAELQPVITIATQVAGLPLALELAATWRITMAAEAIADELTHNLDFLASNVPDLPPRQRSMRAIFQTSWRLLTPLEQTIFPRLAVFRGGFTAELALAVADADAALLDALQGKSLVSRTEEGRFILHELVRQFAAEQLTTAGQMAATQQRHATALLAFVEQVEPASRHLGNRPGLAALQREYDNVRAALHWSFTSGEGALGLVIVAAMREFWFFAHFWQEGCQWHEMALAVPVSEEMLLARSIVLNERGLLLGLMGEIALSKAAHQESLHLFAELNETAEYAWTLHHLACLEYQDGDNEVCNELLFRALDIFRQAEDERGLAAVLERLTLQMVDGDEDLARAERFAAESLAIARRLDLRQNMAGTLILLGEIMIRHNKLAQAEAYLTESRALSEANGGMYSWALGKLGYVLLKRGKLLEAKTTFQEVLCIRQELGAIIGVAWMLEALGEVAVAVQEYPQAGQMFGAAATLRARYGQPLLAVDKRTFEDLLVETRTALGEAHFAAAWQQGEELAQVKTDFAAIFGQPDEEELALIND